MAITYKATFRPEMRKDKTTGEIITINVPLMLDLSYYGRCWYNTGVRLQDISDFNVGEQKLESKKKAYLNRQLTSATKINSELETIKAYLSEAFNTARALKEPITAKSLIHDLKKLSGQIKIEEVKELTFLQDFRDTVDRWLKNGIIATERRKHYSVTLNILERFLKINKLMKIKTSEVTADILLKFQDFLYEEYTLIDEYPEIYNELKKKELPKERTKNTVASKMRGVKAFFNELEENDIIVKNPFRKISKRERVLMLKETYDEPIYLTLDELLHIVNSEVPKSLERVRDCFLLQCTIGARVDNFNNLTWKNIHSEHGFYYVRYMPSKTNRNKTLKLIDTPIVKFGADILNKYKGQLSDLLVPNYKRNVSGKTGYNFQIKQLLAFLEMNRTVIIREGDKEKHSTISEQGCSKMCRKTHVDITAKTALKKNISGLHEDNSDAVDRYTSLNIQEKFELYCKAFSQPKYKIEETK
jgi:hypothetical protein